MQVHFYYRIQIFLLFSQMRFLADLVRCSRYPYFAEQGAQNILYVIWLAASYTSINQVLL